MASRNNKQNEKTSFIFQVSDRVFLINITAKMTNLHGFDSSKHPEEFKFIRGKLFLHLNFI